VTEPGDPQQQKRINGAVLIAVVLFVAATVFLMLKLREGLHTQDCEMAGHKDCAPIGDQR
jgi:hypothetical protein